MNHFDFCCDFLGFSQQFYLELSRFRDETGCTASVSVDFHLASRCRYLFKIFFSTISVLLLLNTLVQLKRFNWLNENCSQINFACNDESFSYGVFTLLDSHTDFYSYSEKVPMDFSDKTVLGSELIL